LIELLKTCKTKQPNKNLAFIFTTGEELGTPNGVTLLRDAGYLNTINFAIALEPTN
jgi:acetylornithine deacetylase/succinyl-diaminopimelate desuccinylase-like protein